MGDQRDTDGMPERDSSGALIPRDNDIASLVVQGEKTAHVDKVVKGNDRSTKIEENNGTVIINPTYNIYPNDRKSDQAPSRTNSEKQIPPGMEAMLTQFASALGIVKNSVMNTTGSIKPGHIDRTLCNIIVYGDLSGETKELSFERKVCLVQRNFTAKEICDRFIALGDKEIRQLREIPSIVTEETHRIHGSIDPDQDAYIGFIDNISVTRKNVIMKWHPVCNFSRALLYDILDELQIDGEPKIGELTTSHWSMKAIDVLSILKNVGVEI